MSGTFRRAKKFRHRLIQSVLKQIPNHFQILTLCFLQFNFTFGLLDILFNEV